MYKDYSHNLGTAGKKYYLPDSQRRVDKDNKNKYYSELNLTPSQIVSAKYHNDLSKAIPRAEIEKHVTLIKKYVSSAIVAGSYRRGAKNSSDIDVIVREPLENVIKKLTDAGYIKGVISAGARKFSGVVKLPSTRTHRHLDLIFTTPREFPFALLYFTGSKKNNILMRIRAKSKGLKLNQYGLWANLNLVQSISTERGIFKALGIIYLNPEDR
jgi:DNA polymerase/3'-5' exonuclease PolX